MGSKDLFNMVGLGERLRRYRIASGKTQKEIATLAEIAASSYANYENGNRIPSVAVLKRIADAIGVQADLLLTESAANVAASVCAEIDLKYKRDMARLLAGCEDSDADTLALEENEVIADDFTLAMHNATRDLTEEDKALLLEMAKRLRNAKTPSPDESKDG